MQYETTLEYTIPLIREGVRGYWRRSVGDPTLIALPVAAGLLGVSFLRGNWSWDLSLMLTLLLLVTTFIFGYYFTLARNAVQRLRELGASPVVFKASEETFTISSGVTTSTAPWSSVKEVWKFRNCWLLLFSRTQFMNLPLASVPEDTLAFVLKRVAAAGGKIDG